MYIYIEKMGEVLRQIQMDAVNSSVPSFSSPTLVADRGIQSLRWRIQDKTFTCSKRSYTTHTITKKSGVLIILNGSM